LDPGDKLALASLEKQWKDMLHNRDQSCKFRFLFVLFDPAYKAGLRGAFQTKPACKCGLSKRKMKQKEISSQRTEFAY
jgi:hypothetical protein